MSISWLYGYVCLLCGLHLAANALSKEDPNPGDPLFACNGGLEDESISLLQVHGRQVNSNDDDLVKPVQQSAWGGNNGTLFDVIPSEHHHNLCQNGKHFPELFLLGCQKCASSSLAADIMDSA